jgi:hypothetical protein
MIESREKEAVLHHEFIATARAPLAADVRTTAV